MRNGGQFGIFDYPVDLSLIQRFVPETDFCDNAFGGGFFPECNGNIPVRGKFDLKFRRTAKFAVQKKFLDILIFPLGEVRIIFQSIDDIEPLIHWKSSCKFQGMFFLLLVIQLRPQSAVLDF